MKNTIYILIFLIVLTSCKAWDPSMMTPPHDPVTPKLLTLERRMEDLANTTIVTSDDEIKVFTKEVENNLMNPYGDKYGYIALKRSIIQTKLGMGQYLLSNILLTIPNLFGMPFMNIRDKVEVELRVLDKNNKLIGKYSAIGESRVKVAYFSGYSMGNAMRKSYPDALIDAFNKIRPQIQADVDRINEELRISGKM